MLYTYIRERVEKAKIPQIMGKSAPKTPLKSIISIQTTNYTFFKKSLKIEGFKSFFFLLNKTYDFWTNFSLDKRIRQERRKGQDKTRRKGERKGKGEEKREGKGYIPRRGGGGKLIISTLTKKRKISTPYIVYNIIYRLI